MTEHIGNWMLTYTGRRFYPIDPRPEDVCTEDIAHALSRICRFAGNTYCFYSVAEHSVHVSDYLTEHYAVPSLSLVGLLHDAAEAYMGDVPSPVKRYLRDYAPIELGIDIVVRKKFNITLSDTQIIKDTDAVVTESEIRQLMRCEGTDWANFVSGKDVELLGWSSEEAEYGFLDCFHKLMEDIEEVKK